MVSLSLCTTEKQGRKLDSSNYRKCTLLSTAGNILVRVLLNRLIPTVAQEKKKTKNAIVGSGLKEGLQT